MAGSFSCDLCAIEIEIETETKTEYAPGNSNNVAPGDNVSSCLCGLALAGGFPPALHKAA